MYTVYRLDFLRIPYAITNDFSMCVEENGRRAMVNAPIKIVYVEKAWEVKGLSVTTRQNLDERDTT